MRRARWGGEHEGHSPPLLPGTVLPACLPALQSRTIRGLSFPHLLVKGVFPIGEGRKGLQAGGLGAAVGLDDVLDGAAADGAAGMQGLLQAQAAGIAQAHVTACVDDRVHCALVADGAFVTPRAGSRAHRRLRQTHWGVGSCPWEQREGALQE